MLTALVGRWASRVEDGASTRNPMVKHAQPARDPMRISPLSFPFGSDPFLQLLFVATSNLIVYCGLQLQSHCSGTVDERGVNQTASLHEM